jgi:hypothetical protein
VVCRRCSSSSNSLFVGRTDLCTDLIDVKFADITSKTCTVNVSVIVDDKQHFISNF